jgi:outer membrane protein assembly factor BamB/SAM-dependent methyltransferase
MRDYDKVFHVTVVGDRLYFGSSTDDCVRCLDVATGDEKWRSCSDGPVRVAPELHRGRVFFGADDGFAYCLSSDDGQLVWRWSPVPKARKVLNNGRLISQWPCRTGVLVKDDTAYFAASMLPWAESYLCAVDAQTGRPEGDGRYVRTLSSMTLEAPAAASAELLVFPQGRVAPRLFGLSDGNDRGQLAGGGGSFVLLTDDARVVHGPGANSRQGAVSRSDTSTRKAIAGYPRGRAMVVRGHIAYMLTDDALIASDWATKTNLWNVECHCPHSLILAGNTLLTGGQDRVEARDAGTGRKVWSHPVSGRAYGLAVAAGRLFVSTDTGTLYAFRPGAGAADTRGADQGVDIPLAETQPPAELVPVGPNEHKDLIGRWVFQTPHVKGGVVKDLAGDLDAKIAGSVELAMAGRKQALRLDGTRNSVLIRDDYTKADLPTQAISAEAWVRVDRPLTWGGIVGAVQDNGSYERGWILGYNGSRFSFAVSSKGNPRLTYLTAAEEFISGGWYHVVGTYDGERLRVYVNGTLAAESTDQRHEISYPPRAFYEIAAYHDDNENYRLTGMLHEVCVYRQALSAEDIRRRFRQKAELFPQSTAASREQAVSLACGPWLQFTDPTTAVVRWETKSPSPSIAEFRLADIKQLGPWRRVETKTAKTQHDVALTGLKHNRTYTYRIGIAEADMIEWTKEYECDTLFNFNGRLSPRESTSVRGAKGSHTPKSAQAQLAADRAAYAIDHTGIDRGACLVLGCGPGHLVQALAERSRLRIVAVDTDKQRVAAARDALLNQRLYGNRVSVHHVESYDKLALPGNWANLIISDASFDLNAPPIDAIAVVSQLRPDGGTALLGGPMSAAKPSKAELHAWLARTSVTGEVLENQHGAWVRMVREPLPGAGDWSHQYGRTDNSAFGGEALLGATNTDGFDVQWVGRPGPRFKPDRNGRKPAPLSTGGRLFIQGLQRVAALDAYNGTVLWSLEIPDLMRFNMPRDCSNWCADRDHVYAAVQGRCWRIDARDGTVSRQYDVLPPSFAGDYDWGYVASDADRLVGSAVRRGTPFTNFWGGSGAGWYDATGGEATFKACSDNLFAVDKASGERAWDYAEGLIINSTITIGGDRVYFVETRNTVTVGGSQRRLGSADFWKDQFLVALDAESGQKLWEQSIDTADGVVLFCLAYGHERLALLSSGANEYSVYTFEAATGRPAWNTAFRWRSNNHGGHMSRPTIVGDRLYVRPAVFDLETGARQPETMPGGGCGTYAHTEGAAIFRAGTVTLWDCKTGGRSSWHRLRPDCWLSAIPAAGMLLCPEGGGGCSCGNWMETSVGFMPKPRPY